MDLVVILQQMDWVRILIQSAVNVPFFLAMFWLGYKLGQLSSKQKSTQLHKNTKVEE